MAKDAGYKIVAHMMPDLPNCGVERDIWQFQEFFENPAFRSDGLKLYPTLVIRGTGQFAIFIPPGLSLTIRFVRAVENRKVQELSAECLGGYSGENHGFGPTMDKSVPSATVR